MRKRGLDDGEREVVGMEIKMGVGRIIMGFERGPSAN